MQKRIIALLLVLVLVVESPVMFHKKAYATLPIPLVIPGAKAVAGAILAVAGTVGAGIVAGNKISDVLTPEEEEEYYSSVSSNNVEAVKKLYQDGYFDADEDMKSVIGSLVEEGDDTSCSVSLEKFIEDKGMTAEKDLKVYDQKNNDGDDKKVFAPSKELLSALADGIKDAIRRMIEDKKKETEDTPYFPAFPDYGYKNYVIYLYDENYYLITYSSLGVFEPALKKYEYINGGGDYMSVFRGSTNYIFRNGNWDIADIQFKSYVSHDSHDYTFNGNVTILYHDFKYVLIHYHSDSRDNYTEEVIPANPYPWGTVTEPPSATEIVNNYFSEQNITYNEDIYNYETNNFFTEEKYLLPADPADLGRDVLVPASQTIINNYNSLDTDVTLDYINNVVIPTIITDINADLSANTDLILKYLDIDNVIDFSGTAGEDTWNGVTFFGLEKKFPFCLPFDFVRFLSILDAEPRAPCITVTIPFSSIGIDGFEDYTLTVDFSQYDGIAELVRTLELLGGVLGLILVTKKLLF